MKKRYDKLVLILLLAVMGAGIFITVRGAFEPYVTFAYSREARGNVQVRGVALEGTMQIMDDSSFSFEMRDTEGTVVRVFRTGFVPPNLFEAEYVVVKGRSAGEDQFMANKILVKCPSKYEAENQEKAQRY